MAKYLVEQTVISQCHVEADSEEEAIQIANENPSDWYADILDPVAFKEE